MSAAETETEQARLQAENERLRGHIAALEQELLEVQARANASVAHWQERAYWLERWHLDLNALMRRRGAMGALAAVKLLRSGLRLLRQLKWRLRS